MRLKSRGWVALGGLFLLLGGGVAAAQGAVADADLLPSSVVTDGADEKLTPSQMLVEAEKHMAGMDRGARVVRRQLSQARQERDVVKVLCLNDKLNQIDVALASGADRQDSLKGMVQQGDGDRARHEYTIIAVLADRVRSLQSEANQCVGEDVGFVGDSEVTVDIDPGIPDTDPSDFPDDPIISEPPVLTSPTY